MGVKARDQTRSPKLDFTTWGLELCLSTDSHGPDPMSTVPGSSRVEYRGEGLPVALQQAPRGLRFYICVLDTTSASCQGQ